MSESGTDGRAPNGGSTVIASISNLEEEASMNSAVPTPRGRWVKFEEEPATIQPSSIEVVDTSDRMSSPPPTTEIVIEPTKVFTKKSSSPPETVLTLQPGVAVNPETNSQSDQTMANGDIICTVLPTNRNCAWVTKANFRPNLVPEEIMSTFLTITVEDYVLAMQILTNDVRFSLYNVLYKRILLLWMLTGFVILMSLLFSGTKGLALFGGGIIWLIMNATGIFVCMWIKFKLYHLLERCMAHVNNVLYKHHILIGLDDRGKLSCHKVNLIFVYFDTTRCIKYLSEMLEAQEKADASNEVVQNPVIRSRMDIDHHDIIITRGSVTERVIQKEKYAEKLLLRYSQRWVKEFVRKRLDLSLPVHPDGFEEPGPPVPPRHCAMARCPCQYIEEHLKFKPLTKCSISELCC